MSKIKLIKNIKTGIIEAFKNGIKVDEITNMGDEIPKKKGKNNSKTL